jgi:spore maturation protein CgeB
MLVVSSPHGYTTRDVFMRVIKGLERNGVDVRPYDLLARWQVFETLLYLAEKKRIPLPEHFVASLLAYEPVLGASVHHDVDAVLVVSPQYMPMPIVDLLRRIGKKTIGYFTESPYEDTLNAPMQAAHFDYVFVNDKYSVSLYRSFCERSFYLPHSYDPEIHYPPETEERENKVLFIGTGYKSRAQFFAQVDWSGIDLELYGLWWMRGRSKLRPYLKGKLVENDDTAEKYRRTAVGISVHRKLRYVNATDEIDDGEAYSVGPRTYELAACGTFQVSDYRPELRDIFGDAVPVYTTPEELGAIVRRALDNPDWRARLAREQRAAVADGHDCTTRMRYLLEQVA